VLICFGYPQAHEDDAERAGRAGLALIEAVGKLAHQRAAALARWGKCDGSLAGDNGGPALEALKAKLPTAPGPEG
jgi:hypothetical protein